MKDTDKNRHDRSEAERLVRLWVEAYARDALPEEEMIRLVDRLSSMAVEWARSAPDEGESLLEKVKREVLSEFQPNRGVVRLGTSVVIKGELTGSESIYIDGRVEGSINLAGNSVTVGPNGVVSANISAKDIVVLGMVRGNLTASNRVDIRTDGSLTGDVVAARISIEDGAYFKGGIDIAGKALAAVKSAHDVDRVWHMLEEEEKVKR